LIAPVLLAHAEAFVQKREWEAADRFFRSAVGKDETAASRIAFGVYLADRERFNESIVVLTPVLDGTDRFAIGVVCHNLAAIYRNLGEMDLARRFQWRATLLQPDLGTDDLLAMTNDALLRSRMDVAETLIEAAIEMEDSDEELDDGSSTDADLMATKGLIQASSGCVDEGVVTIFRAYCRHRDAGNRRGMGADLLNLSALFGTLNRYRAERACLIRAMKCFQEESISFSYQTAHQRLERVDEERAVRSFDARRN
jgi:hypothetical protein